MVTTHVEQPPLTHSQRTVASVKATVTNERHQNAVLFALAAALIALAPLPFGPLGAATVVLLARRK